VSQEPLAQHRSQELPVLQELHNHAINLWRYTHLISTTLRALEERINRLEERITFVERSAGGSRQQPTIGSNDSATHRQNL
jgi:hypothetical protein